MCSRTATHPLVGWEIPCFLPEIGMFDGWHPCNYTRETMLHVGGIPLPYPNM